MVISHRYFGTTCRSYLQGSRIEKKARCPQYGFYTGKTVGSENSPPSHFVRVNVLPFLAVAPVRISSIMEHFCPSCTNTLPSIPTTYIDPIGWHSTTESFHCPRSSLNKIRIGATVFLLDSWALRMGPKGCVETSVINHHYSMCSNPEEHGSQLLYILLCKFSTTSSLLSPYSLLNALFWNALTTYSFITMIEWNYNVINWDCSVFKASLWAGFDSCQGHIFFPFAVTSELAARLITVLCSWFQPLSWQLTNLPLTSI